VREIDSGDSARERDGDELMRFIGSSFMLLDMRWERAVEALCASISFWKHSEWEDGSGSRGRLEDLVFIFIIRNHEP
jgi:hypothetical protein